MPDAARRSGQCAIMLRVIVRLARLAADGQPAQSAEVVCLRPRWRWTRSARRCRLDARRGFHGRRRVEGAGARTADCVCRRCLEARPLSL